MPSSSSPPTVKVRILIISDTHSALPNPPPPPTPSSPIPNPSTQQLPFPQPLNPWDQPFPKVDILLHCGDLTSNGSLAQHERAFELLNSIDAELKIVIPGNHDLTLDREYYDRYPNQHCRWPKYDDQTLKGIRELYDGEDARKAGIRYMVEGLQTFTLPSSGATFTVYASAYTPEFCNWGFAYPRTEDRFNPPPSALPSLTSSLHAGGSRTGSAGHGPSDPVPSFQERKSQGEGGVDIMLTHGPPKGILDRTVRGEEVGCDHLMRAVRRCRPRVHAFGHIHEGWGAVWGYWDGNGESARDSQNGGSLRRELVCDLESQLAKDGIIGPVQGVEIVTVPNDVLAGSQTLFVNASIMDVKYRPVQAPWLMQMELSCPQRQGQ